MCPKITQKRSKLHVFSLETSGKNPFLILIALKASIKKGQRKNLP